MIKKRLTELMTLVLAISVLCITAGCSGIGHKDITSPEQLNEEGRTIGVTSDTADYKLIEKNFPKAEIAYFNNDNTAYESVRQGKIDAYVFTVVNMQTAINKGLDGVMLLDETLGEGHDGAVAVSPETKIPDLKDKINKFLKEMRDDGTLDEMEERWMIKGEEEMPDIPEADHPELHLVVGTAGTSPPFTFYSGTELVGYDIELAKRFAASIGADIEFKVYDYDGIVAAAQAGDVDCIFANLFATPERRKEIEFSDPTYNNAIGIMVKSSGGTKAPEYKSLSDFSGKRIGASTGAIQGPAVEKQIPSAEVTYYNSHADLLAALRQGRIDGFADGDVFIRYMMIENKDLTYLKEPLTESVEVGAIFSKTEKGDRVRKEFNEYLKQIKADGTYKKIDSIWFGDDESLKKIIDVSKLSAENGTLKLATDNSVPPVSYVKDNNAAGMDIDIASRFCEAYGYGLEIVGMNFSGVVDSVASERCDFGIGGIAKTAERAESVNFSDTMYESNSVIAYIDKSNASGGGSFIASLKESFNKTFIREDRWKLFLSGILTTLLITILSIIFGTILGFIIFMICRRGGRAANLITRFCIWLINGMPVVVLLMILYYIIFSKAGLSGGTVSVIAFTMIFTAAVFSMVKAGVGAIDIGQTEAAYSLGYTDLRAFFRIVMPQALPHIMPTYKAQITALIKATAVVGYIAVQDLTKMGDIVRSRTYEAFFPLIAVAVIYFILAAILTYFVNRIELRTDPKRRTIEKIKRAVEED